MKLPSESDGVPGPDEMPLAGLRVHSDGTARGTTVYTEDGTEIKRVKSIHWEIESADMPARLVIELQMNPVQVLTDPRATEFVAVCPMCGDALSHKCINDGLPF